jgi:Subtilase family
MSAPSARCASAAAFSLLLALASCASAGARGGVAPAAPAATAAGGDAVDGQVLITLAAASRPFWERITHQLEVAYHLRAESGWPMRTLGVRCVVFDVPRGGSLERTVQRLAADPRVESAQPVYVFAALGGSDPYLSLQHGADALRLEPVHRWATGRGVKVAVIDTGVDFHHPDLVGRIVTTGDFVAGDRDGFDRDVHGTAVAGILAAAADNDVGIAGVAPEAELLALKACRQSGPDAAAAVCDSFSLAKALDFAVAAGARVINLSLAGPRDPLLARLIDTALGRGVTVVAAARDDGADGGEGFPASLDGVIAVRSAGAPGGAAVPTDGGRMLLAPGVDILTTVPGGGYDFFSGSSMAASQVSGVVALLLEREPSLAPARVARLLRESSRAPAADPDGGGGVVEAQIDACGAVSELLGVVACGPQPAADRLVR